MMHCRDNGDFVYNLKGSRLALSRDGCFHKRSGDLSGRMPADHDSGRRGLAV